jgi:acyl-coenzyme A synthetase/AMP-(fatty) acid ligase
VSHVDFLLDVFRSNAARDWLVWRGATHDYAQLITRIASASSSLAAHGIPAGSVVSLEADYSPIAIAALLALIEHGCVVVPLAKEVGARKAEFLSIAQVEHCLSVSAADELTFQRTGRTAAHELLRRLTEQRRPGLVLFSSGSTGQPKAALHDFVPLLAKFRVRRRAMRTLVFLLFDHIGGVNTLLYTLSNAGCIVTVEQRSPDSVCEAIAGHRVQLLPTSPTFLNLLLCSGACDRWNLDSLELVTYGTEVMPESTLARVHQRLPRVELLQTYGTSEIGILRSKSKGPDSLLVRIGGEGYETRVVDGLLEIKAASAMLGYLNAPSPFTADGWFKTGDAVVVEGEYLRILGRQSEIINVGGEKVYPAEVESELQKLEGVEDVTVTGERHPLTGQIVVARVRLRTGESLADFRARMWQACAGRMPRWKIPQKVVLTGESDHNARFKKMRRGTEGDGS